MIATIAFVAGFAIGLIIGPERTKAGFAAVRDWIASKIKRGEP
jgi:hypothetical protein